MEKRWLASGFLLSRRRAARAGEFSGPGSPRRRGDAEALPGLNFAWIVNVVQTQEGRRFYPELLCDELNRLAATHDVAALAGALRVRTAALDQAHRVGFNPG